jgi:hypothetical protein
MLVACVLLGLQAGPARLPFAERYDQAFLEARQRNVPVLLLDFDGWTTDPNQAQWSAFYEDSDFLAAAENAVLVLASQEQHGERKERVEGSERAVCSVYGGVPCSAHRDVLPKAFADFGRDGQLISPLIAVATPDHKEVGRLEHEQRPAAVVLLLKEGAKRLGPGLRRSDYLRLSRGLQEIRRLADLHEYASVVAICEELQRIPGDFPPQQELRALEQKLDETARGLLARAHELWAAARHLDALLQADDVRLSFGRLAAAATASQQVSAWEKSLEGKPHHAALKADRAARQLYQQGVEFDRKGDAKRARETLAKLARSHPDSRFTERARALLQALQARQ